MEHRVIHKQPRPGAASCELQGYERTPAEFTWDEARSRLAGLAGGGLNMGYEAVDRQVAAGLGGREALRCVATDDTVTHISYGELACLTGRFANALTAIGVARQEMVFTLLGRCPELYAAVLGTLVGARGARRGNRRARRTHRGSVSRASTCWSDPQSAR
ncbi:AMP-binding protein, partial [Streptomyces sp. NPDC087228]|uniref:AMP-binding protein n=1 Tax=Streptomyces sp. NPDC087228 TaxID=3365772 RepID=UPI0038085190